MIALPTPFGYVIGGSWHTDGKGRPFVSAAFLVARASPLKAVDAFWSLEMLGNGPEEVARDHLENHPMYKKFIEDYVKYSRSEQWYQVSILFSKDVNPYQMVNNVRSVQHREISIRR